MIKEILLVHHTHTDLGYTHPQPIVYELHDRFIEQALDLADATADVHEAARFRWTCEVAGITRAWWGRASSSDRDRFLAAVKRGQIEVAALEWHLTPLANQRMLIRSLENVRFFRELGVTVRSAMNTDVNGVPWGLVDVLLDHGIDGFSMSVNSHFGGPVTPRPGAFRWVSPDGRELTVWNGFQYWHAANLVLHMPSSTVEMAAALPAFMAENERRGYPLSFLPMQITNPHHPDNATPDSMLSDFVRRWNETDPEVRVRTVLLSDVFDRLRAEDLPTMSGDWTDYWNLGAGSSIRETTVMLEGLRTLDTAHELTAWPGKAERRESDHLDAAHEKLAVYAEHTWGADCSISLPESIETYMQWSMKSVTAYEGAAHARIVLRDGLHRLAQRAGGEEPTLLLYNPLPCPVHVPIRLPMEGLEWPLTPGVHHRQRLTGALGNLPPQSMRWCAVELPALGYQTYPVASLPFASSEGLAATDGSLSSTRVTLRFKPEGGVSSLVIDGQEYAGDGFGVPILERPTAGTRSEIMKLDFSHFEPADGWTRDWKRDTFAGKLVSSEGRLLAGAVEFEQTFEMANGDGLAVIYRLFADDPTVDVETVLNSAGDAKPYSLALPFSLPEAGATTWHFDTAGAVVEFDREQLPDSARHYVTCRHFVRMQTERASLSIATPDLPLWKFGGMFFAPTNQLNPADRRPTMLAWLANNYWEVNFLANQSGITRCRYRLMPGLPEAIETSYGKTLPYAIPPSLHGYREMGPVQHNSESLLAIEGDGVSLEAVTRDGDDVLLTFLNLKHQANSVVLLPGVLKWGEAYRAGLDGATKSLLARAGGDGWLLDMSAREACSVRLLA